MKRIGCILLILTIILTGCKTGNKNKNDKENKTAVEKMKVMKILSKSLAGRFLLDILMRRKMSMNMMEKMQKYHFIWKIREIKMKV